MRLTKVLIHTDNIVFNINQIKKHTNGAKICAVVKADGYGSSAAIVSKVAAAQGIKNFAVATVSEGVELRKNGIEGELLLLSPFDKSEVALINEYSITPCISDEATLDTMERELALIDKKALKAQSVYLAVDTGMSRVGCFEGEVESLAKRIKKSTLTLSGLITHFSVGDSLAQSDIDYTVNSFETFKRAIDITLKAGFERNKLTCTASASSAFLLGKCKGVALDMVRAGIILYGYPPSDDAAKVFSELGVTLKPVMSVVSTVAMVKKLSKGQAVSYGRTYKALRDTFIAVIPIGYADGVLRRYGSFLRVAINGKSYPVAGRICMDMFMVDLGDNSDNIKTGDAVTIFGDKSKGAVLDALDLAKNCDTISYEVTSLISKRVPRVAVGGAD